MVQTANTDALEKLLAPHREQLNILSEALKEVNQEDNEKKKEACKNLIRQCLDLQKQMDEAERAFTTQKSKCDKQLGKLVNRLNNMANNKPLDDGEEKPEEA